MTYPVTVPRDCFRSLIVAQKRNEFYKCEFYEER
jgi:hypothetical protein